MAWLRPFRLACALLAGVFVATGGGGLRAADGPSAILLPASTITFPEKVDCNTPMVWDLVDGAWTLFAMASWGGTATRLHGNRLDGLASDGPIAMEKHPGHGLWMEAVVPDEGGAWYGFYHHETPAYMCERPRQTILNIGLARSRDRGRSWENLGIILEGPPNSHACTSLNKYQLGGVGDPSVMLDADSRYLYVFFSQYGKEASQQGVAIARMAWAARDEPVGALDVLQDGIWLPPRRVDDGNNAVWEYPAGTALVPVGNAFHDGDSVVDAFWGAAVHWNTYLQRYVMLLNRAKNEDFENEGIYVSFSAELANPQAWTAPAKLMNGGEWYPRVAGLDFGGTDREAGQRARFFLGPSSASIIQFSR